MSNKKIECTTFYGKKKLVAPEDLIFRPSVYGFVVNEGKLLVMKSKGTGKWALSGGGIEKGELISEALIREVKEETDLDVSVGDFVGVTEDFFYYNTWKEALHSLLLLYDCQAASLNMSDVENAAGDESATEAPEWVDIRELK